MQIALNERKAALSIREFAEFRLGPAGQSYGRSGRWRSELGQSWHRELQEQAEARHAVAQFEVAISGVWLHRDWSIALQGRIDQVIEEEGSTVIREVKTVNARLPRSAEDLEREYVSHFNQLAAYMKLAALSPDFEGRRLRGELVFVDIADGVMQTAPLGLEHEGLFERQVEQVHVFLENRWKSKQRLQRLEFHPPFPVLRPGQEHTGEQLEFLSNRSSITLFEAPTGFGKTGMVLEYALGRLRDGLFDRVIYLTGKSTGQLQVIRQVESMLTEKGGLHYFQMRNKSEHATGCDLPQCDGGAGCRKDLEERWSEAGLSPLLLYRNGTLTLHRVKTLGNDHRVCPYEISRAALPFAELWVGDFNYVFSPRNNGVFFNQPGFNASQTLLILDEAHNLPSRVARAYSHELFADEAEGILDEIRFANAPAPFILAYESLVRFLQAVEACERIDLGTEYELAGILRNVAEQLQRVRLEPDLFSPQGYDKLWSTADMPGFLEHPTLEKLLWSPRKGSLSFTCLSAASEIAATIGLFGQTVMMSATLSPRELFLQSCGIDPGKPQYLQADTPWRDHAYRVALDMRVNTRFRTRADHYATTAETAGLICAHSLGPVAVFFPSYRYAETILEYLKAAHPELRLAVQPRGLELPEQERFILDSLVSADALFLVLGSGFAEGIDVLGGRVSHAMVAGPALPEVNAAQKARMDDRSHLAREEAFLQVYQAPGMMKINQALGRLVRAPGQKAKILLHCRRFAEPSYQVLLHPEYRNGAEIRSLAELNEWLST